MPNKTKTIVIIESHELTIIRRSRRVSSQLLTQEEEAQTSASVPSDVTGLSTSKAGRWGGAWWLAVALKRITVFVPWSDRSKRGVNERRNKQP